jgi:hypothetical protein
MTRHEVKRLVEFAAGGYPGIQAREVTVIAETWYDPDMLGKLSFDMAMRSLKKAMIKTKYIPTVAEILEQYDIIREDQSRDKLVSNSQEKTSCGNCYKGAIIIVRKGVECGYRCPCALGENFNGWPMAPAKWITSDRSILFGEEVDDIPF